MKKLLIVFLLVAVFGCGIQTSGQVINTDSLEKTIRDALRQGFGPETIPGLHADTSKIPTGKLPINLDQIFREVNKTLEEAKASGDIDELRGGYYKLSTLDSMRGNYRAAYENYKLYTLYQDSLRKKETEKRELQARMQYELDKQQAVAKAEQEKKDAEARRIRNAQYFAIGGLGVLLVVIIVISLLQRRNNLQKKRANILLQSQKEEVETALSDLKAAQTQLIHAEKMAGLGELTAGIAHEIQNPLNFVNNFSDVNREMLGELKEAITKGNTDDVLVLAGDLISNEEKISYHGKRADAIVKGMLQHSRVSTGEKEPVDVNELVDEYLRLAFHGLRARDKTFHSGFETNFDPSLPEITVIPQDIGRVLLNLINNAFYAVDERAKAEGPEYTPLVTVSTRKMHSGVAIRVTDNGNGIAEGIREKIFQPFFTTKPTGHGTGLGLSLAYDIVTKGHGGEIQVESTEGVGTTFTVRLPARM